MDSWAKRIGLIVVMALLGWFLGKAILSRSRPPVASGDAPPPTPTVLKVLPPPRAKPVASAKKKFAAVPKAPVDGNEGNVIPFRVVNGQAIAYGDILLGTPDDPELEEGYFDAPTPLLWDRPEIPYTISAELPHPERVEQAIRYMNTQTAVKFVPYDNQQDVVVFEPGNDHCYSLLGRTGGAQPIRLSAECRWHEVLHEMMHALGFVHEQSRRDRDQYVEILWSNIDDKYKAQFQMVPETFMTALRNTPFDYRSIMMYRPEMFARNPGLVTMRSKGQSPVDPVAEGLSEEDKDRLRRLYR